MSVQSGVSIAVRGATLAALGVMLAASCRPPAEPGVAAPAPRVDAAEPPAPDAGAVATNPGTEDAQLKQVAEEVPIERLIADPGAYFGRRLTTAGWVVSCDVGVSCTIPCRRCIVCTSRATFVPPGTDKMVSCQRNGTSLIIMDLDTLNKYLCNASTCEEACFRKCSFPAGTSIRLTGTIKRATPEQMGIGEEQYVFVPDSM
ncbi:MAG: hypothetical protein R3B13_41415 [Polyangiaceae bacterium]